MTSANELKPGLPAGSRLLIDWFSMTTRAHSVDDLVDLLGIRGVTFEEFHGNHGFAHRKYFGGISIHYNRDENEGVNTGNFVWLEMSGQGCRTFETYGTGDFEALLMLANKEYGKDKTSKDVRLNRIDIAFDDMDNVLDIKRIFCDTMDENFVTRMSKYEYHGGSEGKSVTFGSKQSNILIRIYDKAAERGYSKEEVPHWVRCELQLKNENACGFAWKLQFDGMQQLYLSVLKNYLSFRVPNVTDSNKRRWPEAEYWSQFLEEAVAKSLYDKPGVIYNLHKCVDYVMTQPIGSIKTIVRVLGLDHFIRMILEAPFPKNPKYLRLIHECEAEDPGDFKRLEKILERQADDTEFFNELREGYDEVHRIALDKARSYAQKNAQIRAQRYLENNGCLLP